jgi:hypothetical protein
MSEQMVSCRCFVRIWLMTVYRIGGLNGMIDGSILRKVYCIDWFLFNIFCGFDLFALIS